MNRRMARYRAVDLCLFALMLFVFESIIITASSRWFPGSPYTVSLTPAITAIVLVRWGPWAGVHAALGALVLCIESAAAPIPYAVYGLGNLFALAVLPCLRFSGGTEAVTRRSGAAVAFGLAVLILMQLGRALIALGTGAALPAAAGFFTTEVITDLFTLILLWIVRRLDGLLEDQRHYLRRIREEQENS